MYLQEARSTQFKLLLVQVASPKFAIEFFSSSLSLLEAKLHLALVSILKLAARNLSYLVSLQEVPCWGITPPESFFFITEAYLVPGYLNCIFITLNYVNPCLRAELSENEQQSKKSCNFRVAIFHPVPDCAFGPPCGPK